MKIIFVVAPLLCVSNGLINRRLGRTTFKRVEPIFRTGDSSASLVPNNSFLVAVLSHRGGASNETYENLDSDIKDEMQQLRHQWSSVPAVPSISWPFDIQMAHGEHPTPQTGHKQRPIKAIIIMDGFSPYHGQYLAHAAHHVYGAAVIHIMSDFMTRYIYQVEKEEGHLSSRLPDLTNEEEVEAWKSLIPSNMEICGVYCESDSGLDDAERLGVALGLYPKCHDGVNEARRNKYLMNRKVGEAGLDVVKQKLCKTIEEAELFAETLGLKEEANNSSSMIVVKPVRGVASDDVYLCTDLPSLRSAFRNVMQSAVFGSATSLKHEEVLVQEFATGTEYAIDVVCRDGERKIGALWKYDKRATNGAPFVYFSTKLVNAVTENGNEKKIEQAVCDYVFEALDALDIRWGLQHVEVIVEKVNNSLRVRLVEVNCRQHNTDFRPLTNAVVGYNALDMTLAAYFSETRKQSSTTSEEERDTHQYPADTQHLRLNWDDIPTLPSTLAHGAIVHFVSFVEGVISRIRYDILTEMEDLESVMDMEVYPQFLKVGNDIQKTIDIRSDTGWAHLINDDGAKFSSDYERLVHLMGEMFEVE